MSPDLEAAYESLCRTGEFFTGSTPQRLDHRTFRHPNEGVRPVMVDSDTLGQCANIYAGHPFRTALRQQFSLVIKSHQAAATLIDDLFNRNELIWGMSGFASPEYEYHEEGRGLWELYSFLSQQQPSLITDGGVAQGVLGLNGVLAALRDLPSLGCIPYQGLASLGQRTHVLVHGETYRDREMLVGSLPDILVCVGGGPGTIRECLHALEHGSVVLLLSLKTYPLGTLPRIYFTNEKMREAVEQGRLLVCDSVSTVAKLAQLAYEAGLTHARLSRIKRLPVIRKRLNVAAQ